MSTTRFYNERGHQAALNQHNREWERMHEIGQRLGNDTPEYRQAREDMLAAYHRMVKLARRPRKRAATP